MLTPCYRVHVNDFDPAALEQALLQPLPGVEAQLNLAHPARTLDVPAGVEPRSAGVLVLLYIAQGQLHFPLIERTSHNARDKHRGQISLPGGKHETQDASLTATALREAEEEIGVVASSVTVLGQLSSLYIPVSNFEVVPTVGLVDSAPTWIPEAAEVERVIEAPVTHLYADGAVKHTDMPMSAGVRLRRVPYFDLAGEVVWGATAMILSELRQVLQASRKG